jgi:hypothetical protein
MARITLAVAVCTVLAACATGTVPRKPEPIPPELIPPGFSSSDCHVVAPAQADVDDGPGGSKYSHGERSPQVACTKHGTETFVVKTVPTCHTASGKPLPLADCCEKENGDLILGCTPKPVTAE